MDFFDSDSDSESDISVCVICLESFDEEKSIVYPFNCKHRLHMMCFNEYEAHKKVEEDIVCPVCKSTKNIMSDIKHICIVLSLFFSIYLTFLFGLKHLLHM